MKQKQKINENLFFRGKPYSMVYGTKEELGLTFQKTSLSYQKINFKNLNLKLEVWVRSVLVSSLHQDLRGNQSGLIS